MLSDFYDKRVSPVLPEEVVKRLHQYVGELLACEEYQPYRGAGLDLTASIAPDAVLLDLGLVDRDGKEVLTDLRAFSMVLVIILSVRDHEAEKLAALDLGADDLLEKPFGISELQARGQTAARHAARRASSFGEARGGVAGGLGEQGAGVGGRLRGVRGRDERQEDVGCGEGGGGDALAGAGATSVALTPARLRILPP